MKKIISLFQRNYNGDRLVRDEVTPGAEWVIAGEGIATRKFDGTCCLIRDGKLYKRYEVKKGGKPPANFEAANEIDEVTGKQQGWVPVGDGPEDQYHREAFALGVVYTGESAGRFAKTTLIDDGTYELIGPKIQGNPEGTWRHILVRHGKCIMKDAPRDFEGLKYYLTEASYLEGIVWHHPDGRMVKIKRKDFKK